eukprot:1386609-Pyramimonas_sp.AAC.1
MGAAWAVFLAHSALVDCFESMEGLVTEQITLGRVCPSFAKAELLLLLYIDDYIGLKLVKDGEDSDLEVTKGHVRSYLNARGLAVHKEEAGEGLRRGLGLTISGRPYTLK